MEYNGMNIRMDDVLDAFTEVIRRRDYKEVYTFEDCMGFYQTCKKAYPSVTGFVLSVKRNYEPKCENDRLIIIQAMIDEQRKPVQDTKGESLSKIEHAKTIDKKLLTWMEGKETKIMQSK